MSANTKSQTATTVALRRAILKIMELPPDQQEAGFDQLLAKLNIVQLELATGIVLNIGRQFITQGTKA